MDTTILVLIIMLSLTFSSLVGFVVYFLTKKQNNTLEPKVKAEPEPEKITEIIRLVEPRYRHRPVLRRYPERRYPERRYPERRYPERRIVSRNIVGDTSVEKTLMVSNTPNNSINNMNNGIPDEMEVIANEVIANEVIANEVIANEVIANEVIGNEVIANEVIANEVIGN